MKIHLDGLAVPFDHDLHATQQLLATLAGALSVLLLFPLEGVLGSAAHSQEKLIVHLDDMIERRLQCIDQKTRYHRMPLGCLQPAQVPDILAPCASREL